METEYALLGAESYERLWLSSYTDDVAAISAFCRKYGIFAATRNAIGLAKKSFQSVTSVKLLLSEDPEGGEETLVVEVSLAVRDARD